MTDAQYDYDLFVIGAGSGGVRASRIAAGHGARVAVAEEYRVGGTCVIRGCVPKKLLVYGSHFAEELQDAANYGWTVEKTTFDWPTLRDAVLKDVDRLNAAYTSTLETHHVERFLERAVITGPNSVRLAASGRDITAKVILVATGAWPVMPEFEGAEHCITSNEVFHLDQLPAAWSFRARVTLRWNSPGYSMHWAVMSRWSTAVKRSCAPMIRRCVTACFRSPWRAASSTVSTVRSKRW